MREIKITLKWDKESAITASQMFYEYDMKNSKKRYVGWLFVALTQFGIVGALKHDSYGLLYLSTFLVTYWYYGRWYLRSAMIKKYYATLQPTNLYFTLKDDGLYNGSELIGWDDIFRVISLDDGVLVHTNSYTLFFERKAFQNYDDLKLFLDKMNEKGKK